ncbi:hypothetical protein Bca52824_004006 [Brassica carinata]|uniref:F-box domain-containing protein n=1 Tax=Brassica carinata TaxID=52824 RepID=A0A8X7WNM5_BRACI|nr:hypothetical protein Bca52824_004006 [Brassica carinata]
MKSKAGSFAKKHLGQEHDQSMADLPQDLAEEVLSRLPMTSLASVRSTCKAWNALSKDSSFTTKHFGRQAKLASAAKDDFMLVLMMDYEIYLVSVNLDENADDVSWMRHEGTLVSQNCTDQIDVCEVFHCYGLLLCISQDNARLVVWNPYWGQSMWLEPAHSFERLECYIYDLGYDKSSNSHKILSFADYTILHHTDSGFTDHDYQILDHTDYDFLTDHYQFLDHSDYDAPPAAVTFAEYSIYDFNTHSWRVLDVTLDLILDDDCRVSIGGNTYWFARSKASGREEDCCLLCFDYTRETFGARLPLPPLEWHDANTIALSSVGEEQLAILFPWLKGPQLRSNAENI